MASGKSPMVGGLCRVCVNWFLIISKCDSSLQIFPHLAVFLISGSFLRAIRGFWIVLGGLLPLLCDAFGSDILSEGCRWEHMTFLDTVIFLLGLRSISIE